ncbi:MAG: hypothetical protein VXY93_10890 [Pseudomonadota bacterium]|nr:hypothetical protein [Pseudomonadota bacterium]
MTIKSSGSSLSFSEIEAEFGQNGGRSLGAYRLTQSVGSLSNLPLDTGIPTSGQIKFSDFYAKQLNVVVDCHSGSREDRKSAKNDKWNNNAVTVIGGFRSKKESGSRILINVNKKFCSDKSNVQNVALRTGSWDSSATVQVDIGSSASILGAGGDGGKGADGINNNGDPGSPGTSGLGIDHNNVTVNIASGAVLRAGFGGGGGGGGGRQTDKRRDRRAGGGGGGGGMGCPAGLGGNGGSPGGGFGSGPGSPGGAGTETSGGGGGGGGSNDGQAGGGPGGSGGQASGSAGSGQSRQTSGGSGGGDGAAIRRISGYSVTINNNGTIQGDTNATGVG